MISDLGFWLRADLALAHTALRSADIRFRGKADISGRQLMGEKIMEWLKQKTAIGGVQISNWMLVLGAVIIVLLVFQNLH